jgi:hypothetical protein
MMAWLSVSAWAGIIQDPAAQIDAGSGSNPLSTLGAFSPCGDLNMGQCTGLISLYNDTGGLITSVTLNVEIDPGLSIGTINANFNCNTASLGNPFFLNCTITYTSAPGSSYGLLTISFLGVNPFVPPSSGEIDLKGLNEGIPPVPAACLPDPDLQCPSSDVGHFEFNFLDLGSLTYNGANSGWIDGSADNLFLGGTTPTFEAPLYTDAGIPEPGTSSLLAAGLLSLVLLSRRNYFSRNSRS